MESAVYEALKPSNIQAVVKEQSKPTSIFACVDTERVSDFANSVTGIGLAVLNSDGVLLKKLRLWIKFDTRLRKEGGVVGKRCKEEFWDKHPDVWDEMVKNGKDEKVQILTFVNEWDKLEETFGKIELVCDNPEFDFGALNDLVFKYCGRRPLRYAVKKRPKSTKKKEKKSRYRSITDLGEVSWFLDVHDIVNDRASEIVKHSHRPDEDAEFNIISHLIMANSRDKILEKCGESIQRIVNEEASIFVANIKKRRMEEAETDAKKIKT